MIFFKNFSLLIKINLKSVSQADIPGHNNNAWWNVPGCAHQGHVREVWVFNPRGFSFEDILANDKKLIRKYRGKDEKTVLPKIWGYPKTWETSGLKEQLIPQSFKHFQLSDIPGGNSNINLK